MAEESKQPAKSKIVPILLAINGLAIAGGAGFYFYKQSHASSAKEEKKHEVVVAPGSPMEAGPTMKLDDFVIHLRNPEAERYARLTVALELSSEENRARLKPYIPRIRDAFVAHLSDRTAEELSGSENLANAKAALLKRIEELVPGKMVRALYFTDFVIQ